MNLARTVVYRHSKQEIAICGCKTTYQEQHVKLIKKDREINIHDDLFASKDKL